MKSYLACVLLTLSQASLALDVYTIGSESKKLLDLSPEFVAKHSTTIKATDPNFPDKKPVDYSGVSVEDLSKELHLKPTDTITFICKDN